MNQSHIDEHVQKVLKAHPHLGETEEQLQALHESAVAYLHAQQRRQDIFANERKRKEKKHG